MATSAGGGLGLTLHQAARELDVPFAKEYEPTDRNVQVNGINFHYLEWGEASGPTILMLHGVSQQAHSWDFVSLALSDKFHIIALTNEAMVTVTGPPTVTTPSRPSKGISMAL